MSKTSPQPPWPWQLWRQPAGQSSQSPPPHHKTAKSCQQPLSLISWKIRAMCHPHSNGNNPGRHTHKAQYDKLADHTPFHEEMTMTNNGTTNTSYTPQITLVPPAHHCIVCLSHSDDWQVTPWHCMHQLIANMTTPPHGKTEHLCTTSIHLNIQKRAEKETIQLIAYTTIIQDTSTISRPSTIQAQSQAVCQLIQ